MDELAAPYPEDSRGSASGLGSERSLIGRPAKPEADKQRSKSWRCTQEAPSEAQQLCAAGMDRCTSKLKTVAALAEGRGEAAEEVVAPPSPSKVKRFSLRSSAAARLSAAGGLPKRWNQFYTEESVNQRVKLMQHPKVKHALDQLWSAANFNTEDEIIDKEEYLMMHRKIVLALEPGTWPSPWPARIGCATPRARRASTGSASSGRGSSWRTCRRNRWRRRSTSSSSPR